MLLELERRVWEVSYLRTEEGWEVDFFAHRAGEAPMLVQVCLETSQDAIWERKLRALQAAGSVYQDTSRWLVTLEPSPPRRLPEGMVWASAASWLLGVGGAWRLVGARARSCSRFRLQRGGVVPVQRALRFDVRLGSRALRTFRERG